jgi:hypothetical protein
VFSLKMLVSHKEYGLPDKELSPRGGGKALNFVSRAGGEKDRNFPFKGLFEKPLSDPGTSGYAAWRTMGEGDVWVSTPKNAS